jgi:hypothetical protein
MRKVQRDALPLNGLPRTTGLTRELRELTVYFEAFHCHPNTRISSCTLSHWRQNLGYRSQDNQRRISAPVV